MAVAKKKKKKDKKKDTHKTQNQLKTELKPEPVSDKLTAKQELFCKIFATSREFFGNGVHSYIEAYKPSKKNKSWYQSSQVCASRLLSNVIICNRINHLLELGGMTDVSMDKHLLFVATQYDDLSAKMKAIIEFNKLKGRIVDKKQVEFTGLSLKELYDAAKEIE